MHNEQPPRADDGPYSDRPYERDLVSKGRRIVSLDLDATLLDQIDDLRRKDGVRRGLQLDRLLRIALSTPEAAMT
jgi:hypothetical protein